MQYGNIIPTIYPTGVFIQSIEQTKTSTEAGGKNIITATLTNHTQQRFEILNGAKGDTGDAASIKEITASIDNGIGTPSVSVSSTGTGAEKTVHFDFRNLKGETGNIALTEEVKQHISQSVASANQYTDDAIGAVEQRIDTGDTNTLQAAKKYTDTRLFEIKMPLNPVCHYDMADVQYIDVTQNNLKNFSYTFREGDSYTNYSTTAIDALKNGHRYRITADFESLQGKMQYATMCYYDFDGGGQWGCSLYVSQTPVINGKCRCILDFVCKKTELSGHRLEVLFYNGQAGHISSKDTSRWSNFRIETISDSIAIDASGNGNHATIVGDVEKATDNATGAMTAFNKGFLTRPPQDFIGVGKQWSHSRWIKINPSEQDKTHNPRIWRYGAYDYSFFDIRENNGQIGNVSLYCHRNSKTYLYCALSKESILDNKWHHLVVMTDLQPSYCRKIVYFDRQKIFDEKEMGDFSDWMDNQVHFDMGTGIDISSTKGHLANLICFDRFLTETEIQWLYLNPYYPAKRYSLAEYKADENRKLLEELKKRIPTP